MSRKDEEKEQQARLREMMLPRLRVPLSRQDLACMVRMLRDQGMNVTEIAQRIGRHPSTVRRYLWG